MAKNIHSNFSPTALKRSQMADKDKAYNEKLSASGVDTYDPKSLNKGVFGYSKDGKLIVRQLARAATGRNQSDGEMKVNRSNKADFKWDAAKGMYRDKNLGDHYTKSSGDEKGFDVYGVETTYTLDPETGALVPEQMDTYELDEKTGEKVPVIDEATGKVKKSAALPSHFSFRDMRPNAGYFGQWLKVRRGKSQEEFNKLDWTTKAAYLREAKQDMMLGWQHAIANGYDPEKHRIHNMPINYDERDSTMADAFFGRTKHGYSRSGDKIKKENRGRGQPEREKLSLEQSYYRSPDKYKNLDDETRAKVLAEEFQRRDAGQTEGLSQRALASKREYEEYKRRKAEEKAKKDNGSDPEMGETPSDEVLKEIRGICARHAYDQEDFLAGDGSVCTFGEYKDAERHSLDDSMCYKWDTEQTEMHDRVLTQLKKLSSKKNGSTFLGDIGKALSNMFNKSDSDKKYSPYAKGVLQKGIDNVHRKQ